MANWQHKIEIKKFLSDDEDYETCKEFISNVYNVLKTDLYFKDWEYLRDFENFPEEDSVLFDGEAPMEYVNNILDLLYDFCDDCKIWVG